LINEGAKILEEGIAYRPGDIDLVWVNGYGFPDFRGGPMHMADAIGLQKIAARLDHYGAERGDRHGYWSRAGLLTEMIDGGHRFADWPFK
jgi:3-hydroxyacyl-CoA dehydrogenase